MSAVVTDPLVLSILSKPRGDRHYRFHQGHRLRALLSSLIQQMVCKASVFQRTVLVYLGFLHVEFCYAIYCVDVFPAACFSCHSA